MHSHTQAYLLHRRAHVYSAALVPVWVVAFAIAGHEGRLAYLGSLQRPHKVHLNTLFPYTELASVDRLVLYEGLVAGVSTWEETWLLVCTSTPVGRS